VKEENGSKEQWKGEIKKKPYMGANPEHAPTSPNAQHMEEDEQLDEISGTATSFGGRHNPRRSTAKYLAGKRLKTRVSLQASGNQRRRPGVYEEVREKIIKKLSEKNSEKALGKTATGQPGETINTEPTNQELTGPTR
jgi:hypothetical protein